MLTHFLKIMNRIFQNFRLNLFGQKKERYFLPFIFFSFLLFDKRLLYNTPVFITLIFISCMILFINFPILVTWTNSKPLYYDDLYLDSQKLPSLQLSDDKKKNYKKLYKISLTIYDSIMIAIISNYWVLKTKGTTSLYEIFGITGGLLQIFHVLNLFTGTVLLYSIKHMINKESKIIPILNRMHSDDNMFLKYDEVKSDDDIDLDENLNDEIIQNIKIKPTDN